MKELNKNTLNLIFGVRDHNTSKKIVLLLGNLILSPEFVKISEAKFHTHSETNHCSGK